MYDIYTILSKRIPHILSFLVHIENLQNADHCLCKQEMLKKDSSE